MPDGLCKVGWGSGRATRPLGRVFGGGEGVALVVMSGKQECSTPEAGHQAEFSGVMFW